MGETDDKDPPQQTNGTVETAQTPAEDATETDKLLKDATKVEIAAETTEKKDAEPKVNGEEIINIPDEKETATDTEPKKVNAEEKEVKPKKIPIGGIKIPGFFTRNKDKSKGDGAENELLENGGGDKEEEKPKEDDEKKPNFFDNISQRLRSTFARKPADAVPTEENKENEEKVEDSKPEGESTEPQKDDQQPKAETTDQAAAPQEGKKTLLGAIKLPTLGSILPKRLRKGSPDDIELGNGPNNRAGLASMETLDDSLKDTENNKDTTDKAAPTNATDEDKMENIKLTDDKDADKAAEAEQDKVKRTLWERVRAYRCSIDDIAIIGGLLIFAILVALILVFTLMGKNIPATAPIRDGKYITAVTSCGAVEGILEDSSFAFRGIPYAVPPVGEKRWRQSELPDNIIDCWNGTLKAHNATTVCSQILANNSIVGEEDCLTMDIITPHVRYDNPLPVVVLIGADTLTGPSPGVLRPSARYARAKDVVFVRPNFRLGVLGFLALKDLSQDSQPRTSGNYALGDIVTALKWISLNIAHFGGDPNSVTLVGYRAGATLVTALASSNQTRSLYARAWVSSGSGLYPGRPLADSEKENLSFERLNELNCSDIDCLRSKSVEDLLNFTPGEWRSEPLDLPKTDAIKSHEWLVLDGEYLAKHPLDVWKNSAGQPKIVIGTTIHSAHSETLKNLHTNWTEELVRAHVQNSIIGAADLTTEVFKRYNATYQGLVQIISDIRNVCPLYSLHQAIPGSTFYVVSQTAEPEKLADIEADIQSVLGRYEPHTFEQRRYTSVIQNLFYHYVSHGSIDDGRNHILEIGQDSWPREAWPNCDFWIKHDIVPRYARRD